MNWQGSQKKKQSWISITQTAEERKRLTVTHQLLWQIYHNPLRRSKVSSKNSSDLHTLVRVPDWVDYAQLTCRSDFKAFLALTTHWSTPLCSQMRLQSSTLYSCLFRILNLFLGGHVCLSRGYRKFRTGKSVNQYVLGLWCIYVTASLCMQPWRTLLMNLVGVQSTSVSLFLNQNWCF